MFQSICGGKCLREFRRINISSLTLQEDLHAQAAGFVLLQPFLLLDCAGPYLFAPSETRRGVGEHPHRGFETVTIVYQGELEHRDSTGSHGTIGPGDVQWMTAAGGVVHEEFHSDRFTREGGELEAIQLWVNLPAKDKLLPPKYQGIVDAQIPKVALPHGAGSARVIAGGLLGVHGPARTFTPINLWDLHLVAGISFDVPLTSGQTALAVVQSGAVQAAEARVSSGELVLFDRDGGTISLRALTPSRILILTGQPLNEPVVGEGPFVMNSREQIRDAIRDYQSGRMRQLSPVEP